MIGDHFYEAVGTGIEMLFANCFAAQGFDGFDIAPQTNWALLGTDNGNLEQFGNLGSADAQTQYYFTLINCRYKAPL